MLKKIIKYTDYNDLPRTQEFFFYLSKKDLQDLNANYDGGLQGQFNKIINNYDQKALLVTFEDIVLSAYGLKSEDGTKFIKNEKVREDFKYSAAYEALFDELTSGDDAADKFADFLKKILPAELQAQIAKADAEGKTEMPEILAEVLKDQDAANAKVVDINK
jgi:hypothetical protein